MLSFIVSSGEAGSRLDHFLKKKLPDVSRRDLLSWIAAGRIRCDGRILRKGLRLEPGVRIDVNAQDPEKGSSPPTSENNPPLRILFEDSCIVAVEKPPLQPTHALHHGESGTVANELAVRYPEMVGIGFGPLQPGIVHRLDRDTSGVLIAARKPGAFESLREQFRRHDVIKIYYAIVHGSPGSRGTINLPIGVRGRRSSRVEVCGNIRPTNSFRNLKPAETTYRRVRSYGAVSLVRLVMKTGVRHQLRAHMAHLGHPIVGDNVYGPGKASSLARRGWAVPQRQLLHASEIRFFHPEDGRAVSIRCGLPSDMRAFIASAARHG